MNITDSKIMNTRLKSLSLNKTAQRGHSAISGQLVTLQRSGI